MPNDFENQLRAAIKGLLYTSETDAPFEIVHWRNGGESLDEKKVLQLSGHKPNDEVETMSIEEFFKDLTSYLQNPASLNSLLSDMESVAKSSG